MNFDPHALHEQAKPDPRFRPLRFCLVFIGCVLLAMIAIGLPVAASAWRLAQEAQAGRTALLAAAAAAKELDFPATATDLGFARTHLAAADRFGSVLAPLTVLPYVGKEVETVRTLVRSSLETATALERVAALGDDLIGILARSGGLDKASPTVSGGVVAFFRLPLEERRAVLADLNKIPADFSQSVSEIDKAIAGFSSLPDDQYLGSVIAALRPMIGELQGVRDRLAESGEMAKLLPALAGYPEAKNYLLLLQNNTELRPTGGFIGTIGTVTIADATAKSLQVQDVYALDGAGGEKLSTVPPLPLAKYLSVNKWYLRDANWSPDFPTAAKQVANTYQAESGQGNFDGVIAVDPTLAADLLRVVGNITIGASTFTPDNVTDEIEFQVEKGFSNKGLPVAQRKDVLVALAGQVFTRLLALPADRWQQAVDALVRGLDEKHVLIASFDPTVADFAQSRHWDGAIRTEPGDYLSVVDANLAALKTDSVMSRSISYSVKPDANGYVATVNLRYANRGGFSWKTTRYRTYTRLYVPLGSQLISVSGNMANDKILDPQRSSAAVDTVDELGRRSFGTFLSVEPGETRELIFNYRLPASIISGNSGNYGLLVEKQAGTVATPLTLSLDFGKRVARALPAEPQSKWGDNLYQISTDLVIDRQFQVGF